METTANALTNKTLVAEYLSLSSEPAELGQIINYVSGFIERYCNRHFAYDEYTGEVYDDKYFQAKATPLHYDANITVVNNDGSTVTGEIEHATAGIIKLSATINGRVTYTGGYVINWGQNDHTLPQDITGIATRLSARIYEKRLSEGKNNESVEGQSITWSQFLTDDDKTLLDTYVIY